MIYHFNNIIKMYKLPTEFVYHYISIYIVRYFFVIQIHLQILADFIFLNLYTINAKFRNN